MRKLITMAATLAFAASDVVAAQQAEAPKQEAKPDAKAATGVAGKWVLSMETPNGTMNPRLDLKVDGKKVTGTLTSPEGEVAVAGEFADNKLAFTASFHGNGGDMTIDLCRHAQSRWHDGRDDGLPAGRDSLDGRADLSRTMTERKHEDNRRKTVHA